MKLNHVEHKMHQNTVNFFDRSYNLSVYTFKLFPSDFSTSASLIKGTVNSELFKIQDYETIFNTSQAERNKKSN